MSYTEDGITIVQADAYDGGVILRLANAHADKVLQCYVNGELAAVQAAPDDTWMCELAGVSGTDAVFLLAVDPPDAQCNYWAEAYPKPGTANRLRVRMARTIAPYGSHCTWRVYRGDAGDADATIRVHEAPFYTGGRRACGFGGNFGYGGFGWDGRDAKGFGANFGYGEFGFDCEMLTWTSEPLGRGTYPVKVTVLDAAGNESTASETPITLNAYARPARSLSVAGYTQGTDTLNLTFTPSEDLN